MNTRMHPDVSIPILSLTLWTPHPQHLSSHVLKHLKTPFYFSLHTASLLCHIAEGDSISLAMHTAPHSRFYLTHMYTQKEADTPS